MFQWPVSRLARARLSLLWLKKNALPATFLSRQARTSATSSPTNWTKKALEEGDISLQMRVTQPIEEDVWLEVRGEDHSIVRRSERYVRPGEMVTIVLKPTMAADVEKTSILTVDIYPKSEA